MKRSLFQRLLSDLAQPRACLFQGQFSLGLLLLLTACAPLGSRYGSWSEGPAAAFAVTPNDDCKKPGTQQTLMSILNQRVGQVGGPSALIISADGLGTIPNGDINGPTLTCRGLMQTQNGPIGPGVLVLGLTSDSNASITIVRTATWETDADRTRREIKERAERDRRIAEAPALRAKQINEMHASARAEPNKTVHCGINRSQFWTENAVCTALIDQARSFSERAGTASRDALVHDCARELEISLPGKSQTTYLNACEQLASAMRG